MQANINHRSGDSAEPHGMPQEAELAKFRVVAVTKGLCTAANLAELESKYISLPEFFPLITALLEGLDNPLPDYTSDVASQIKYSRDTRLTLRFLKAAQGIHSKDKLDLCCGVVTQPRTVASRLFASNPNAAVADVLETIDRIRAHVPDAYLSKYCFHTYEIILKLSKEPKHDLGLAAATETMIGQLDPAVLTAYYEEGHAYICHPLYFSDKSDYERRERAKHEQEIKLRDAFSRLEEYPPLAIQDRIIPKLAKLPSEIRAPLLRLAEFFSADKLDYRYFDSLLIAMERFGQHPQAESLATALTQHRSEQLIAAILVTEELSSQPQRLTDNTVADISRGELTEITQQIFRQRLEDHQRRFTEKPLDEVAKAFRDRAGQDAEPPAEAQLQSALDDYAEIMSIGSKLVTAADALLNSRLGVILDDRAKIDPGVFRRQFFAIARELFKREFGVYPYNTQVVAALLLTQETGDSAGRYAQIRTGEGKSLMLAIVAAYYGVLGERVDVITSNIYLAQRDALRFKGYYQRFGLNVDYFSHGEKQGGAAVTSDSNILYSTNQSMIFAYLAQGLHGGEFFQGRRFGTALVDEADNLCLDLTSESCRIAQESQPIFNKEQLLKIIAFVDKYRSDDLRQRLPLAVADLKTEDKAFTTQSSIILGLYILSAMHSKQLKCDEDFIVHNKQVKIVDVHHTGRVRERTQWENGLHEFVALRHAAELPKPMGVAAHMSHPSFLKRYARLLCISGTFGDKIDRSETTTLYGIHGFDVPPHHTSKRIDEPLKLHKTRENWEAQLLARVKAAQSAGRPVLIVAQSISDSRALHAKLSALGLPTQLLNDVQNIDKDGSPRAEQELIELAGQSGLVTVATSVAGRGADIVPSKESEQAGGLLALVAFVPLNKRVEFQARGRAGRQGQNGSSEIIACFEDDIFLRNLPDIARTQIAAVLDEYGPESAEIQRLVSFVRSAHGMVDAIMRRVSIEREGIMEQALNEYFSSLRAASAALEASNGIIGSHKHIGLGASLVSMFMSDTWTPLYDSAMNELNHSGLLDQTAVNLSQAVGRSRVLPALSAMTNTLFPELAGTGTQSVLRNAVASVYQLYVNIALHRETKEQALDPASAEKMLAHIRAGVEAARGNSFEFFRNMTFEQIKAYFAEQAKKRQPVDKPAAPDLGRIDWDKLFGS